MEEKAMHKNLNFVSTVNMPHEEWLERRRKTIGGSDAAAVVGMNSHVSAYSLWAEKTGILPGFGGNLATEVGTYMEEFVAQKFAQEAGKKVRRCNKIIYNPDYTFAHVNIDRDVVGEDAGLECKTTDSLNMKKFRNGEYPENYYVQCVHSMAITGAKRWYLAVLIGNREFKWFTIERDEEEIKALMEAEEAFWTRVKCNIPPVADGSSATGEALKTIYPNSNDAAIGIGDFERDLDKYFLLKDQSKELDSLISEIENKIKAHLGDCGAGEGERYKVSWKTQTRQSFDAKQFTKDHPEMDMSKYFKSSSYRTFRVTEKKVSV